MTSNLPDGVTENMIPGNRPEDLREDSFWEAFFERLDKEKGRWNIDFDKLALDCLGQYWADHYLITIIGTVARDLGYDQGFGDGKAEAQMSQMAEECIRCGYAHSVQEHCHCGDCDYSHSPTDPCVVD